MNQKDILKLVGVKSEAELYKLYPTHEKFLAKFGKKIEKAEGGLNASTLMRVNNSNFLNSTFGNIQSSGFNTNMPQQNMWDTTSPNTSPDKSNDFSSMINPGMKIAEGITNIIAEGKKRKAAQQWANVSDVVLQAAQMKPEQTQRKYVRPEDIMNTGEEFFPIYGVGTNVLRQGGEITNTYAPNTLYKDLGYAEDGLSTILNSGGSDLLNKGTQMLFPNNAGYQLGSDIGGMVSAIPGVGPIVGALAKPVLGTVGGLLDTNAKKIKAANEHITNNIQKIGMANEYGGVQNQYTSFMRTGGNLKQSTMNGDLQTHWGGYAEPISQNPYLPEGGQTVMFRGQSHDDGGIGMSYGQTPVEVEGGEPAVKLEDGGNTPNLTVFGNLKIPNELIPLLGDENAKGKKFKSYIADLSKTEERKNKLMTKSGEAAADVDGNSPFDKLKLNSYKANILGSNMVLKDIAEKKTKAAQLQKAINETAEENGLNAEHLSNGKIKKAPTGITMAPTSPLRDQNPYYGYNQFTNVDSKGTPLFLSNQEYIVPEDNSINSEEPSKTYTNNSNMDLITKYFSDEKGFTAADRQKAYAVMMGESSGITHSINTNRDPKVTNPKGKYWNSTDTGLFQINNVAHPEYNGDLTNPEYNIQSAADIALKAKKAGKDPFSPWVSYNKINKPTPISPRETMTPIQPLPTKLLPTQENSNTLEQPNVSPVQPIPDKQKSSNKFDFLQAINSAIPYLRPSNAEALDPRQLTGEMYGLSHNQLEPVYAQTVQPDLTTPYDVSYQDMLNANQSDYRATEKMLQNNPAALSMLNAQKYGANEKVLGEQFRQNQAEKNNVYAQNRNIVNQTKLTNLNILANQQNKQAQAKSNTKAINQEALQSIASKYLQNDLQNKTLQTYENMYNYRYDNQGRLINMNPSPNFNIPQVSTSDTTAPSYGLSDIERMKAIIAANEASKKKQAKNYAKTQTKSNGGIVRAMK